MSNTHDGLDFTLRHCTFTFDLLIVGQGATENSEKEDGNSVRDLKVSDPEPIADLAVQKSRP